MATLAWLATTALVVAAVLTGTTSVCQQEREKCICHQRGLKSFDATSCSLDTTYLDLSSNELLEVDANMFSTLINLKTINLDNNIIFTIHTSAFGGLFYLETLHLSNNNLTYLPRDLIRYNSRVTELCLKSNNILIPPCGPLLNSTSLETLNLTWCGINTLVEPETFSYLPSLKTLELSGNSLQVVNPSPFRSLEYRNEMKVIKNDTILCSAHLEDTILQLIGRVKFEHNCSIKSKMDDPTMVSPTPSSETEQALFDLPFTLTVTSGITLLLVVVMMVIHFSVRCKRKRPNSSLPTRTHPLAHRVVQALHQVADPFNGGYEQPSPRTEEDMLFSLPFAPLPPSTCSNGYPRIISDDTPMHSPETEGEDDVFFDNKCGPFENHNRSFLNKNKMGPDVTLSNGTPQHLDTRNSKGGNGLVSPSRDNLMSINASSGRQNVSTVARPSVYSQTNVKGLQCGNDPQSSSLRDALPQQSPSGCAMSPKRIGTGVVVDKVIRPLPKLPVPPRPNTRVLK